MHPEFSEEAHEARDLLEAQHLGALEPRKSFAWHAVLAAEVAAIRDGEPEVVDAAAVARATARAPSSDPPDELHEREPVGAVEPLLD